jgi:hypothetical protein
MWNVFALLATALLVVSPALAHDDEDELSNPARGLKLQFLPPPMEGTISMGVFDKAGKLVRTLKREADVDDAVEFVKAVNGLVSWWDGKDDAGNVLPKGKYSVRGFSVGDLQIEGVATHGNDWIVDENSQRWKRVAGIGVDENGGMHCTFAPVVMDGSEVRNTDIIDIPEKPNQPAPPASSPGITVTATGGKLTITGKDGPLDIPLADGETVIDAAPGFGNVAWAIVQSGSAREVHAYTANGDFLRRMQYAPGDPLPVSIKPSPADNQIHLLEQDEREQRVRTLRLETAPQPTAAGTADAAATSGTSGAPASTWRETFSKTIWSSDTFDAVKDRLKFPDGTPFVPQAKIRVSLRFNEMEEARPGSADVAAAIDAKGSRLTTADGLLLRTISDTPGLKWAVIGRPAKSKTLVVFQGDGVTVEEFHIHRPADMMPFDLGAFDVDPAALGKK